MAHRQTLTTGVRMTCEPPHHITQLISHPHGSREYWCELKRRLDGWVNEFHDFIRDHRSQDPVKLNVQIVTEDVCSDCLDTWEPGDIDGVVCCLCCGKPIEQAEVIKR